MMKDLFKDNYNIFFLTTAKNYENKTLNNKKK